MKKKLVIFGLGQIAELANYYFSNDSSYEVSAFCIDNEYLPDEKAFQSKPILPFSEVEKEYSTNEYEFFIAVSYKNLNRFRAQKFEEAKNKGYRLANYVSTKATVLTDLSDVENCFILENNTIQPFVTIGNNVTLWSGNHIGHHSRIEDNNFISSHVVVSGNVHIKQSSFFGVNSTIRDGVTVASYNVIAANSFVSKDTKDKSVIVGNPGKYVKSSDDVDL